MNKCDFCENRWYCKYQENGICLRDEEGKDDEKEKRCVNCEHRCEEDGNVIFTSEECTQCAGFITGYRNFKEKI